VITFTIWWKNYGRCVDFLCPGQKIRNAGSGDTAVVTFSDTSQTVLPVSGPEQQQQPFIGVITVALIMTKM